MELDESLTRFLIALAVSTLDGLELYVTAFLGPAASTFLATVAGAGVGVGGSYWLHLRQETAAYRGELRRAIADVIAASSEYEMRLIAHNAWSLERIKATISGTTQESLDRSAYLTSIEIASLVARGNDVPVMDALVAAVTQMRGASDSYLVEPVHTIANTLVAWQRAQIGTARAIASFRLVEGKLSAEK